MTISSLPRHGLFIIPLISSALFLFCFSSGSAEDPARMVVRALSCFNNKLTQIYSGCNEEYRLNESGNINVPPQIIDQFCNGPCLSETQQLLSCINNLFSDFRFDNKASIRAISDTIRTGCSFSEQRGNFNVAQYTSPAPRISVGMSLYAWIVIGFFFFYLYREM